MGKEAKFGRLRMDSGQHRRVMLAAAFLGVAAFLPVFGRLYTLMVRDYGMYSDLALRNQTRSTAVTAGRGTIYDCNLNVLAVSENRENVYLNPHELKQSRAEIPAVAEFLAQVLDKDARWIASQAQDLKKRYKQVGSNISEEKAAQIRTYIREHRLSGIHLEPTSVRVYPNGTLAAQVLGFTNASNDGTEGVEAAYNRYLSGSAGRVITTKGNNEMDIPFSYERFLAARQGADVILTLDSTVQEILEKQLAAAVARYDVQNGAFGLVMNCKTGEILAMATLGSYDPNHYLEIADVRTLAALQQMLTQGTDAETYSKALADARWKQWRNRVLSDGYEPGSTFKVLTMAAALDCGAITLDTPFYCRGAEQIPGRSQLLHCWRSAGHGAEKTPQALQNSCNIAFAKIGLSLGGEKFYDYVKAFGFMEPTGIDMSGEAAGFFYDKETFYNPKATGHASALISSSFGQTFQVTPVQLVRGIAAVVNGGYVLEPYVVSEILDREGNSVETHGRTVLRRAISQETSETMRQLIESVVTDGTARNARLLGYRIGGKTGTSEKIGVKDAEGNQTKDKIVSFVGIAPMDDPRYIVLVALDTPRTGYVSGGQMGAPTVREVMADILPYLGVPKDESLTDPADTLTVMPDLSGQTLRQAEKTLKDLGLEARTAGSGEEVTGQLPAAGTEVPGGSQVILYLAGAPDPEPVLVPDFSGMTLTEANEAAARAGLYIQVKGPRLAIGTVRVTDQDLDAGTETASGTTVILDFTDTAVGD